MVTSPQSGSSGIRLDLGREGAAGLFGNANVAPILRLLVNEPAESFAMAELMRLGGLTSNAGTRRAVEGLLAAGLVLERRVGRERRIQINPEALVVPPDPYVQIPNPFREPTRRFVTTLLREAGADIWKVLLFGGLAVGRGDRLSDIDLLVVTPSPRPVRVAGFRLVDEFRERGFEGQRYQVHLLVETPKGLRARRADPALARLLRQAVRLWDDPRYPLEQMLPGGT